MQEAPATGGSLARLLRSRDVLLGVGVILIVGMMIVPVPAVLMDLLLATNIALAVTILLVALFTEEPLDFSVFPSILLIVTLYRLALNVSSTRLILLDADAGSIIDSFGGFVVGGNLIVGLIVFLVLLVIQFLVITNGAGRVAEVAARFTLDAMPGKQMAIDADLNAGVLTDEQARDRRERIAAEADFYGAMDGASKFVRGDAIAALIIVAINLFAGVGVGVLQQGLGVGDALNVFALLTVGDGLVSQIPALLISTATGIVITRSTKAGDRDADRAAGLRQPKGAAGGRRDAAGDGVGAGTADLAVRAGGRGGGGRGVHAAPAGRAGAGGGGFGAGGGGGAETKWP